MSDKINYERTDYKQLAKEFNCSFRIGTYGFTFFPRDPLGHIYKLINTIPLTGWITDQKEVERIIRERGMEL